MAGGGSDPCTGSTVKISHSEKRPLGSPIPGQARLAPAVGTASFAFSSLPRFIRDESRLRRRPSLSNLIHALGRVKLRQASGVLFMAAWPETCHPKSPSSGNTPPLPRIAQIKSRHGPVAGTRAVCGRGKHRQACQPAAQTSTNTPSTRQDNSSHHPSGNQSTGEGAWGKTQVWTASAACT